MVGAAEWLFFLVHLCNTENWGGEELSQVDLMEQRGETVGQREIETEKKKDFLWRTEKHAASMALLSPKLDYIFSLQTVFRGEAGKILLVVLGKLKDIPGKKKKTNPNKKFGLKSRFFFRGFFKEMFQIKKKRKLSDSNLLKFSWFGFFGGFFYNSVFTG